MKQQTLFMTILCTLGFIVGCVAFAADPLPPGDFLSMVLEYIKSFGGLSWLLKISGIITLVIASMKVSFLNDLIWSKLAGFKAWAGPILGLLMGIVSLAVSGQLTLASLFAYFAAGAGAVVLHELLDTIKVIPGLGSVWVSIIESIEAILGGKTKAVR